MPVTLNTIPASEAAPLKAAKKSKSSNAKSILAAAATASFILGLLAATAVTPAPTGVSVAFDSQDLGRGQAVAAAAAGAANAQDLSTGENWTAGAADEPSHLETLTVGPTYEMSKAWKACTDCKKGKKYNLSMPLAGSYLHGYCSPV